MGNYNIDTNKYKTIFSILLVSAGMYKKSSTTTPTYIYNHVTQSLTIMCGTLTILCSVKSYNECGWRFFAYHINRFFGACYWESLLGSLFSTSPVLTPILVSKQNKMGNLGGRPLAEKVSGGYRTEDSCWFVSAMKAFGRIISMIWVWRRFLGK